MCVIWNWLTRVELELASMSYVSTCGAGTKKVLLVSHRPLVMAVEAEVVVEMGSHTALEHTNLQWT